MVYKFRTKPWPHQVRGFRFVMKELMSTGSAGLQVPMRWGKSKLAVDCASALHLKYGIQRVLVVTTTSGLGVWEREIPKHCPYPVAITNYHNDCVWYPGVTSPASHLEFYVVHHAVLYGRDYAWGETNREWKPGPNTAIEAFDPEMIIMDESHRIGDPSSMQCKMAYRYGRRARFRLTLTGTMFHRAPLMVFGQCKFLDDSMFGTAITPFRRLHIQYGGYGGYEIIAYKNLDKMADKLKDKVFIEEYVAHTPPNVTTTPVEMEECAEVYRTMEREAVVTIGKDVILAPIILTKHLRCCQIAGGWLKNDRGKYIQVGQEKARCITDKFTLMGEEGINKIVVGCMFVPEIRDLARAAKAAGFAFVTLHGGVPRGVTRDRRIATFQEAERPTVFIAQIQAAAEAIDLSAAQDLIYYSLPQSYLLYAQFGARIERYKETRVLRYDHLLMEGTRDVVTWLAMNLKMDIAKFLVTHPEIVERITRRDDLYTKKPSYAGD